ncbi:hypothetical protein QJS66_00215 [Kocuria rhizophila]|nr:hypothetical protein QJS66_00215 [Kocuria rhizophila]
MAVATWSPTPCTTSPTPWEERAPRDDRPAAARQCSPGANQGVDLRDISMEDLIGRRPWTSAWTRSRATSPQAGAGDRCGRIHRLRAVVTRGFRAAELSRVVDRDESGLQATQISITGRGLLDGRRRRRAVRHP